MNKRSLELAFDAIPDLVLVARRDSLEIVFANRAAADLTGYSPPELRRRCLLDLIPDSRASHMLDLLRDRLPGDSRRLQHPLLARTGETIPVESAINAADIDGQLHLVMISRVMESASTIETALATLNANYRNVFELAPLGIFVFDANGRVIYLNRAHAQMNGIDPAERDHMLGMSILDDNAIIRRNDLLEPLKGVLEGKPFIRDIPHFHLRQGGAISVIVQGIPLAGADQRIAGGLVLVNDISQQVSVEGQLSASETRYCLLSKAIPDELFRISRSGIVLDYKAPTLARPLATPPTIGQSIVAVWPPDLVRQTQAAIADVLCTGTPRAFEYRVSRHTKTQYYEIRVAAGAADETLVMVRDITDQKAVIDELNHKEAMLQGITGATIQLLANNDLESAITNALAILGKVMHTGRVYIYEFHAHATSTDPVISLRYEWGSDPSTYLMHDSRLQNIPWLEVATKEQYHTLLRGEPISGQANKVLFPGKEYRGKPGAKTLLTMPIFSGNRLWGLLGLVDYEQERIWTDSEISVVRTMAASVGAALQRQQVEEKLRQERKFAEIMHEVATILSSTLDRDTVLRRLLEQVKRIIPYDAANVMLVKDGVAQVAVNTGYEKYGAASEQIDRVRFDMENTPLLKHIIDSQSAAVFSDVTQYPDWRIIPESAWIGSWLAAPIIVQGKVVGVFALDSAQRGFYGPEHLKLISPFAQKAAIAFQNAELYQQVQRQAHELTIRLTHLDALYAAGQSILSTLQLDEVLTRLAIQMTHLTNATSAIICDYDPASRSCTVQSAYLRDDIAAHEHLRDIGDRITLDSPLLQRVIEDRRSALLTGDEFRAALPDNPCTEHVHAAFIVPMSNKDRVVGVAIIRESRAGYAHQTEELWLCEALANQAAIALEQATLFNNIRELELVKSAIIRLASHDLRGPLTRLKGFVDLLERQLSSSLTPNQRDYFMLIGNAMREMDRIVNDILSLQRIEAQHKKAAPVVWRDLIDEAARTLSVELDNKALTLAVECDENLPTIQGDPIQLSQAIVNLIGNAIKYTPSGGRITVRGFEHEHDGRRVVSIEVADTGAGIRSDQQDRLFEPFYRGDHIENESISGMGLGLSVVKAAVEYHRGMVYVHSEPGQGSTFGFWVPAP